MNRVRDSRVLRAVRCWTIGFVWRLSQTRDRIVNRAQISNIQSRPKNKGLRTSKPNPKPELETTKPQLQPNRDTIGYSGDLPAVRRAPRAAPEAKTANDM